MAYYDPYETNQIRKKMADFLENAIDVTSDKLLQAVIYGVLKENGALKENNDRANSNILSAEELEKNARDIKGYKGFQDMLSYHINISEDFVSDFTVQVNKIKNLVANLDSSTFKTINKNFEKEVIFVFSKTDLGKWITQRTAWRQYASLVDLYTAANLAVTKRDISGEVGGIQDYIGDNIKDLTEKISAIPKTAKINVDFEPLK